MLLTALLLIAAGFTAWVYVDQYRPDRDISPTAAQTALDAAKSGTVAVLSYGPGSLDHDLADAKARLTGDFLNYYSDFTERVVRPAVEYKSVNTKADVVRAAVSDIQPDQIAVLVFVNQTTTSAERPDPTLSSSSVAVTLKEVHGQWLISSFDPV